ncbi:bifunctional riboflavin kinase/FAD synthetase [Serratia symbiotica]|uniref:bifunctional riboflavin kinase/FAD synthetase n=1 Tax=Serratia symbiotica TaxID=138074 RepID=UPI0030CF8396|nr:bifunctional riboflavin kinase/FAD synthetase [Serratia symbiotica]
MQLIRGIHNIQARHHGCVLTIGNFDGIHRGHQAVLEQLKQEGQRLGLPVMVIIFEPQPLEMFATDQAPARLTRLRDKAKYLVQAGVDYLLCVKFDPRFAANTAQAFIAELLVEKLGVKLMIVGDDFRFGAGRQGDFMLLQQAGKEYGFEVVSTSTFHEGGQRISSTAIRHALDDDALPLAENLLGHPYSIFGRVVYGDELGRTIGFPTANLPLKRLVAPVKGVYAVEVYGLGPDPLPGVANIGTRPTLDGVCQQLEVHLLDVTMDLYGRHIDVVLRMKMRNEQRFASLDALKQQIADDVVTARKFFGVKK